MSKLMDTQRKIEAGVVSGYQKIEDGVVSGYKKIEGCFVSGYKRIEDKFVGAFLTDSANQSTGTASSAKKE